MIKIGKRNVILFLLSPIIFLLACSRLECYAEVSSPDSESKDYVYVRTRNAVMKDNQGHVILRLYAPSKLVVGDKSDKDKLLVEVAGWINEYYVMKVSETTYKANSETILPWLWSNAAAAESAWYYKSIGEITDETVLSTLGETYASKSRDFVIYRHHKKESEYKEPSHLIKMKVVGWIDGRFITYNLGDTEKEGSIRGRLLCKGTPAKGIEVSIGDERRETDETGFYEFSELMPNKEYKLQFYIEDENQWYENRLPLSVLDPGEKMHLPDMDICTR